MGNGEGAHAEAPAAAATTTRVPEHLTMTMEELLATDNIASTHRLVEKQRKSTNAVFDLMNGEGQRKSTTDATTPQRASAFRMMELADQMAFELEVKEADLGRIDNYRKVDAA